MLLDMLAAVARKDDEDRRRRQMEGIKKAQVEGKFVGRKPDLKKRESIASLLAAGHSYSSIQKLLGSSRHLIADVKKTSVHDKFHRTLILSGFCFLKIAKISLNSSFFPKPIKR